MNKTVEDYGIRMSSGSDSALDLNDYLPVYMVDEVKNGTVCAELCTDLVVSDKRTDIDSWYYNAVNGNRTCVCSQATSCYNKSEFQMLEDVHSDFEYSRQLFVIGKQLPLCSNLYQMTAIVAIIRS